MPQAGHSGWRLPGGGALTTPLPPGPPYLSASCPLKYAWTYSVKAVATGSASCEPSTTGLGPRDSPGEAKGVHSLDGTPPHPTPRPSPTPKKTRTHRAPAGRRRRSPARPGWRGLSARGRSSRRARGSASVTARRDGVGGGSGGGGLAPPWGSPQPGPAPPRPPATHQVSVAAHGQTGCRPLRAGTAGGGHERDLPGGCAGPGGESILGRRGEQIEGGWVRRQTCRGRFPPLRVAPVGSHQCHERGRSQPRSDETLRPAGGGGGQS